MQTQAQVSKDPAKEEAEEAQEEPKPPLQAEAEGHEGVESKDQRHQGSD